MAGGSKRGPYKAGVQRREEILDAATARFEAEGFANTSMSDIARDVGLTPPSLSYHFPSKDAILTALADRRFERTFLAAAETHGDHDGTGTLRLMLMMTRLRATQPELIEVFVRVAGFAVEQSSDARALYVTRYERVIADIAGRFQAAVEAGHLRDDVDYVAVARDMIAVSDGLQIQWVLTDGAVDMVGLMRAHLERIAPEILVSGERVNLD